MIYDYKKIKSIVIKYLGCKIHWGCFEELLIDTLEKMKRNKNRKQLLISTDKEFTTVLMIVFYAFINYIDNVCNAENDILNELVSGDKVVKNGRVLVFDKKDDKYIYMHDITDCKIQLPVGKSYMITKYFGNAARINNIKNIENISSIIISQVFNIKQEYLRGQIKNSTLIIVESKEKIYEIVKSIVIVYGESKYGLSEIFPFAYYSSEQKYEFFKGNRIKQNAIIKFVTNSSLAFDLIREDENINNVIFIGKNTYKDALDTEIRQIEMYNTVDKIMLIDTWESTFDFTQFDEEYSIYAFTKNVILDNVNLYSDSINQCYNSKLQKYNLDLLFNIVNKEINIYEVSENESGINDYIYNININLKRLLSYSDDNMPILDFLKMSYSLCNKLEQTIVPLNCSNENFENINRTIDLLKKIKILFPETRDENILMNEVIDYFSKIVKYLENNNLKNKYIMDNYKNEKDVVLKVKNKDEYYNIQSYYAKFPSYKINVERLNKMKDKKCYKNMIMPFYLEASNINVILTNKISNLDIIVYKREKYRIEALIRKTLHIIEFIKNNNKLSDVDNYEEEMPIIYKHYSKKISKTSEHCSEELINIERSVDKLIEDNILNIYLSKNKYTSTEYCSNINIKKFITFMDRNYAFLTNNYKANVLDKEENNIIEKDLDKIRCGDNLIFTFNKINGETDIVKNILKELLKVKSFNEKYGKYFRLNKLWKDELVRYMNQYNLKEEDICSEFKIYSRDINKVTIVNWLNGNIIGPRDLNDIIIISRIVNSSLLNKNIDKVIDACIHERKIQITVRKVLARIILNSVISSKNREENEMQIVIKNTIHDLKRYAYIGEIASIRDVEENMNAQYVNRVIEKEV